MFYAHADSLTCPCLTKPFVSECVAVLRTLASKPEWRSLLESMLRETLSVVIPLLPDSANTTVGGDKGPDTPAQKAVQAWSVGRTTEDRLTMALGSLAVMGGLHADGLREGGRLVNTFSFKFCNAFPSLYIAFVHVKKTTDEIF